MSAQGEYSSRPNSHRDFRSRRDLFTGNDFSAQGNINFNCSQHEAQNDRNLETKVNSKSSYL